MMAVVHTTNYRQFRGVDFSTDMSLISENRSPYAPNMISDAGGMPEKRVGWRRLCQIEAPVNGIFYVVIKDITYFLAHGGTKLYKWTDTDTVPVTIREGIANSISQSFAMGGKLWILTGGEYLVFDGDTVKPVSEIAYVPTTSIARAPSGGGTAYENVNLLSAKRKNFFKGNGTSKIYKLDTEKLDAAPVTAEVNGVAMMEGADFTVDRAKGELTFTAIPSKPDVDGQDNVFVTFSKTAEDYAERICKCTIATLYGVGTSDRVFFSGNKKYCNWDWYSALNDPSYIGDLSYSVVGASGTAIMGYRRVGSSLAIIKEDNGQDSTIFLRTAEFVNDKAVFPLKQGVAGIGAIGKYAFASLVDEPLFLSGTGIYALTSNTITAERTVQNRSDFINARLIKESNLRDAVAVEYKGYYMLAINEQCYILDGKQNKAYKPQSGGDYGYECYHWEQFPACCLLNHKTQNGEALYFGTKDGGICKLNDDMSEWNFDRFNDYPQGVENAPRAVEWAWATKADDDGDISRLKTMIKRGGQAVMKPYIRGSAAVCFRTDKDTADVEIRRETIDIFDWQNLDFERDITFDSNTAPRSIFFRKRVKGYKTLQIIIRGNGLSEGAGIYSIVKHFVVSGFARR